MITLSSLLSIGLLKTGDGRYYGPSSFIFDYFDRRVIFSFRVLNKYFLSLSRNYRWREGQLFISNQIIQINAIKKLSLFLHCFPYSEAISLGFDWKNDYQLSSFSPSLINALRSIPRLSLNENGFIENGISNELLSALLLDNTIIQSLTIAQYGACENVSSDVFSLLPSCPSLHTLSLESLQLIDNDSTHFVNAIRNTKSLTDIRISNCNNLLHGKLLESLSLLPLLKQLSITIDTNRRKPQVRLSSNDFLHIASIASLQSLTLQAVPISFNDAVIEAIVRRCRILKYFSFSLWSRDDHRHQLSPSIFSVVADHSIIEEFYYPPANYSGSMEDRLLPIIRCRRMKFPSYFEGTENFSVPLLQAIVDNHRSLKSLRFDDTPIFDSPHTALQAIKLIGQIHGLNELEIRPSFIDNKRNNRLMNFNEECIKELFCHCTSLVKLIIPGIYLTDALLLVMMKKMKDLKELSFIVPEFNDDYFSSHANQSPRVSDHIWKRLINEIIISNDHEEENHDINIDEDHFDIDDNNNNYHNNNNTNITSATSTRSDGVFVEVQFESDYRCLSSIDRIVDPITHSPLGLLMSKCVYDQLKLMS